MIHCSDSRPQISGDVPAGVTTKMRYLAQCLSQNYAHHVGGDVSALPTITLALPDIDEAEQDASAESAPSRFYCDVFWRSLPWKAIGRELGAVSILELGCGSGSRFRMFSRSEVRWHMLTITLPVVCGLPRLRQFRPTLYRSLLRRCYLRERERCATRPAFYALLVQSGIQGEALWQ